MLSLALPNPSDGTIVVRKYNKNDLHLVMSSWLQGFKNSKYAGPIPNKDYWSVYAMAIEYLLDREGVLVLVACNPNKVTQDFGYIVVEQNRELPVVHWLYVKKPFRRMGIAGELMSLCGITKDTAFYYTYKSSGSGKLTSATGPWPNAIHKDMIARKKRGDIDEATGYLVPFSSEIQQGEIVDVRSIRK